MVTHDSVQGELEKGGVDGEVPGGELTFPRLRKHLHQQPHHLPNLTLHNPLDPPTQLPINPNKKIPHLNPHFIDNTIQNMGHNMGQCLSVIFFRK